MRFGSVEDEFEEVKLCESRQRFINVTFVSKYKVTGSGGVKLELMKFEECMEELST